MSRKCRKKAESWEAWALENWAIPEEQLAAMFPSVEEIAAMFPDEKELAEKLGAFEVSSLEVELPALDIELPPLNFDTTSLDFEPIEYNEGEPCQK